MDDYKFQPDRELLKFADDFSRHYRAFKIGIYTSKRKNYIIHYEEDFETKTMARVEKESGTINISQKQALNENYTENFMFFLVLWSICRAELHNLDIENCDNEISADRFTLDYYLTTRRPMRDIHVGMAELFRNKPDPVNVERMKYALSKK